LNITSIRIKILAIVIGLFSLIAVAFIVYSTVTTENYRQLRTDEISKTAAFAGEQVNKSIAELERNAVDLALAGRQFYQAGVNSDDVGISVVVENFKMFRTAVGGGIWYEPYALRADKLRVCYYAFYDAMAGETGAVRHDPSFGSEEYDFHTQIWYTQIKAGLAAGRRQTVWTVPYYDEAGTFSLMTTVGAGIYDKDGRFIGMATVDREIQSGIIRLLAIKPTKNSFVLLASPHDDYIISNTYESDVVHVGSSLSALPWSHELRFSGNSADTGRFILDGVEYIAFSRILDNGWLFSVQIPSREIFAEIETRNSQFTIIIGLSALILLMAAFTLVSRHVIRPLHSLTTQVAAINSDNLDRRINIRSRDEIGVLASSFNKMILDLKASIEQNAREHAEKERIGAELDVATKIQTSMLPSIFPAFPNRPEFDIHAMMLPAKEVGGDFYDFFLIGENKLAVVIADVSGKGVPAALFMVIAKTLIKNSAQAGKTPGEVFETVNSQLCENNDIGMFVTAFMGYLDIPTGNFTYVNAGHNPPLLKRADGRFEWLPVDSGFILAGLEDMRYKQDEVSLAAGDTLFIYTDGVTEAVDRENNMFTEARLLEVSNANTGCGPEELLYSIKREIDAFANGAEQADDITMLAFTRQKTPVDAAVE
jgi:sigma-B regulation protein RsbU (phosphoserine phosphatase)